MSSLGMYLTDCVLYTGLQSRYWMQSFRNSSRLLRPDPSPPCQLSLYISDCMMFSRAVHSEKEDRKLCFQLLGSTIGDPDITPRFFFCRTYMLKILVARPLQLSCFSAISVANLRHLSAKPYLRSLSEANFNAKVLWVQFPYYLIRKLR